MSQEDRTIPSGSPDRPPAPEASGLLDALRRALGADIELGDELPRGGMSRVFAGFDRALQRKVAVKVLAPELTESLSVERFRREIMVIASLQHPNIVPVLSAGEAAGQPYFVMPFVEGQSLRTRLRRGPLSVRETVSVMRDVARALSFAHERGIVHRDIKPDNVMLTGGVATVTDFGVAKAVAAARRPGQRDSGAARFSTLTSAGVAIGTPAYMAPEQAAGDPETNHRADLYSLGILGYEMLVGAPPFQGRTLKQLMAEQFAGTPPPIETRRADVPADLNALIVQCLAKAAEERPRTATGVVRVLENPDLVSGTFTMSGPRRAHRRQARRWVLAAIVTFVAILAAGVVYATWPFHVARQTAVGAPTTVLVPTIRAAGDSAGSDLTGRFVAEQIAAGLARWPEIRVAGPPAADSLSRVRPAVPTDTSRRSLVLEGALQRTATRTRLTVRLVDERGFTLWGDTFDAAQNDPLAVQDRLTTAVLAGLTPRLRAVLGLPEQ